MAIKKRGNHHYGEKQTGIREELLRYSRLNDYVADHFADAVCKCGSKLFQLTLDENAGAAVRICVACRNEHPIGDSDEYLEDAELGQCACPCGKEVFEITVGVSLYEDSADVKWIYLGCRCPSCGLTATYGDWKNEFIGYERLLSKI